MVILVYRDVSLDPGVYHVGLGVTAISEGILKFALNQNKAPALDQQPEAWTLTERSQHQMSNSPQSPNNPVPGHPTFRPIHSMAGTRIYKKWRGIRARCQEPNMTGYQDYGGRGIRVCPEWAGSTSFPAFYEWAISSGYSDGLTIERINNDGDYEPANCRWIPRHEQAKNRRNTYWVTAFGEQKILQDWSKDPRCVVSITNLWQRLRLYNWEPERAITTPSRLAHLRRVGK